MSRKVGLKGVKDVNLINNCVTLWLGIALFLYKIIHMKTVGIILVVIGLGFSIFTGFTFFTTEKVVEVAGLEITREKPHHVSVPLIASIALIGVGGVLIFMSSKKKLG
jgi:hypothetical protein